MLAYHKKPFVPFCDEFAVPNTLAAAAVPKPLKFARGCADASGVMQMRTTAVGVGVVFLLLGGTVTAVAAVALFTVLAALVLWLGSSASP